MEQNQSNSLATIGDTYNDTASFEAAQRMAKALSVSELIPKAYLNNIPSTMIALELAQRTGTSPIMVMQNLNVIQGKPSWSSTFIIAVINSCKRFSMPLNFTMTGEGRTRTCLAFTTGIDGSKYESPLVTFEMAELEGWVAKSGSKWKTMPDLMLRYRAAAFFGRLFCPELLMGMQSEEEVYDVEGKVTIQKLPEPTPKEKELKRILDQIEVSDSLQKLGLVATAVEKHPEAKAAYEAKFIELENKAA